MALFEGTREPALYLAEEKQQELRRVYEKKKIWGEFHDVCVEAYWECTGYEYTFILMHRNQIIETMKARDAYDQIEWGSSFQDFLDTWLFIQERPHYGPLNPASSYDNRRSQPIKRHAEEDPLVWTKE